jgi:hypothetical protein
MLSSTHGGWWRGGQARALRSSQASYDELGLGGKWLFELAPFYWCGAVSLDDDHISHHPVTRESSASLSEVSFAYKKDTLHAVFEKAMMIQIAIQTVFKLIYRYCPWVMCDAAAEYGR